MGEYNFVNGMNAGTDITVGHHNIVLGDGAGRHLTTECYRLVIGSMVEVELAEETFWPLRYALITAMKGKLIPKHRSSDAKFFPGGAEVGEYNFVVGTRAGSDKITGSYNIILGDDAGNHLTTESYRLVIGTSVEVQLTTESYWALRQALSVALSGKAYTFGSIRSGG